MSLAFRTHTRFQHTIIVPRLVGAGLTKYRHLSEYGTHMQFTVDVNDLASVLGINNINKFYNKSP